MRLVTKFGTNDTVANATWEMVANLSATAPYPWPNAVTTVRVKAGGNAADAAAGAGARAIRIEGVDSNLNAATEDLTLNVDGTLASASTTTSWWRVYRAYVIACGTYGGSNTGEIVIENTAGTADLLDIAASGSQTRFCAFSMPAGWTGYILGFEAHVDAIKPADARLMIRQNYTTVAAPFSPVREYFYEGGILGGSQNIFQAPITTVPPLSDIWMEARGGGQATTVSAAFEMLCIKDEDTTVKAVS
jgi:hypothetical protein